MSISSFLETVSESRRHEAQTLITIMQEITGENPALWGSSIIGFGSRHYKYESGREGDVPVIGFSPRKAKLTLYFEGFDEYSEMLDRLGKHKISVGCLYINKLTDIDLDTMKSMLQKSFDNSLKTQSEFVSVEEYISSISADARPVFDELRNTVKNTIPLADEVLSHGIIGYTLDVKRPCVYISGWDDHVAMYPIPKNKNLRNQLAPFMKGTATLWFKFDQPLPKSLVEAAVRELSS